MVESASTADVLLLVFHGHGSPDGWENGVDYSLLAHSLSRVQGNLLIVNDTCYGGKLLPFLRFARLPTDTCFLAPWDAEDVSYGGCTRDCVDAWSKGVRIEDMISSNIFSTPDGDKEVPIQIRWGTDLDHHFYAAA